MSFDYKISKQTYFLWNVLTVKCLYFNKWHLVWCLCIKCKDIQTFLISLLHPSQDWTDMSCYGKLQKSLKYDIFPLEKSLCIFHTKTHLSKWVCNWNDALRPNIAFEGHLNPSEALWCVFLILECLKSSTQSRLDEVTPCEREDLCPLIFSIRSFLSAFFPLNWSCSCSFCQWSQSFLSLMTASGVKQPMRLHLTEEKRRKDFLRLSSWWEVTLLSSSVAANFRDWRKNTHNIPFARHACQIRIVANKLDFSISRCR